MTSYIGLEPSYGAFEKQLLTGDGTTSTFTLDHPVAQAGQLLVSVDGIVQEPEEAFSISLSSGSPKINFADPLSNGARIFIVYLGRQLLVAASANSSPVFDQFSGDGSTTVFTINSDRAVADVLVIVNGIVLVPTTDYTISGTNLTFVTAPASSAEIQFRYL